MIKFAIPLGVFLALVVLFAVSLSRDQSTKSEIESPLIGQAAPAFSLPSLDDPAQLVDTGEFDGKVWVLNVWATWCRTCAAEHPFLNALARTGTVDIVGLNWKDDPSKARVWLARRGDPYVVSAVDERGDIGIDWGVVATPETFVVDKEGVIRHKHIGAIDQRVINEELLPLIRELQGQTG
jgi:cytochrome c biogenesis protein CcmG/thiol:disulfide interchange protein DsbE